MPTGFQAARFTPIGKWNVINRLGQARLMVAAVGPFAFVVDTEGEVTIR